MIRMAINGFGRIGKAAFKVAIKNPNIEVVAVNGLSPVEMTADLFKRDTVYGNYEGEVSYKGEDKLVIDGKEYLKLTEKDPAKLPWKDLEVDIVLECTGVFRTKEQASMHLEAGAKRVLISAPAKGDEPMGTYVLGVNQDDMDHENDHVISNASCTTNCIAPMMRVLNDRIGVAKAMLTTIHAYTADQNLIDASHKKDLRRARAAALNIVPTSTGAAKATGLVVPAMDGVFDGLSVRVPIPCGSLSDITLITKKDTTVEEINQIFKEAEANPIYKGIIETTEEPIVSSDIIGNPASTIVDLSLTKVVDGNLVKVIGWYDNEYAYSVRLVDQAIEVAEQIK